MISLYQDTAGSGGTGLGRPSYHLPAHSLEPVGLACFSGDCHGDQLWESAQWLCTVSLLSLLPASCFQPRTGKRHSRPLLNVHECGESTPTGQTFGPGTQGPRINLPLSPPGLAVLQFLWPLGGWSQFQTLLLPPFPTSLWPLGRDYLSLVGMGDNGGGGVYMKQCLHGLISASWGCFEVFLSMRAGGVWRARGDTAHIEIWGVHDTLWMLHWGA